MTERSCLWMASDWFENEEVMREEEDIPTWTEGPRTDQYGSEDCSSVFLDPPNEGHFVMLQQDFYQKYCEHKDLLQYMLQTMSM